MILRRREFLPVVTQYVSYSVNHSRKVVDDEDVFLDWVHSTAISSNLF